jgi:putative ABC transport system permease protein
MSVVRDTEVLSEAFDTIGARIEKKTYRSRTIGEVIFGSKSNVISIEGVSWIDEPDLMESLDLLEGEVQADMPLDSLFLPEYIARDVGAQVGESVLVRTSTVTGQQNVGEFTLSAVTRADSMFSFSSAYADKRYLNDLIGLDEDNYQVLNISLQNPVTADAVSRDLIAYLRSHGRMEPEEEEQEGIGAIRSRMMGLASLMGGGALFSSKVEESDRWEGTRFDVLNLSDMMEGVTSTVNVLNTVSYVIFIVLLVITMVGLLNTFRMVLIERTQEIGTMRAIGMQRGDVKSIFLMEALVLAIGGALAGVAVAILLSGVLSVVPIPTDSPVQFLLDDGTFAFPFVPSNIIVTLIIITLATLTAAYLPARKAATLDPAVALRTTY